MYSQKDIEKIKEIILSIIKPFKIILFGSYAKNEVNLESDIDIMVLLNKEITRKQKLSLFFKIQKELLHFDYDVDIVIKNVSEFEKYKKFIGTINYDVAKEGKILWTKQL